MSTRAEREALDASNLAKANKKEAEEVRRRAVQAKDVEELRSSVLVLADRVGDLSDALITLNDMQVRQAVTEHKTDTIEKSVNVTKKATEELVEAAATKIDLHEAKKEQARTTLEFRKSTLARIYTTGILMVLFLIIGVGLLYQYQQAHHQAVVNLCLDRNKQNQIIIDILDGFSRANPTAPGTDSVRAGLSNFQSLIIDCDKL